MEKLPPSKPTQEQGPLSRVEAQEQERKIEIKIARAFLMHKYPLSEKGEELRTRVEPIMEVLQQRPMDKKAGKELDKLVSELPTVENPHLDLFRDFDLSPEQEVEYFGKELACVQVTKGCRHQCAHCAAGAEKNVKMMPFATVLKIVGRVDLQDQLQNQLWNVYFNWKKAVARMMSKEAGKEILSNISIASMSLLHSLETEYPMVRNGADYQSLKDILRYPEWTSIRVNAWHQKYAPNLRNIFCQNPDVLETIDTIDKSLIEFHKKKYELPEWDALCRSQDKLTAEQMEKVIENGSLIGNFQSVTHYYDSDPFDYRDTTFLHTDGTPADYGDVMNAFTTTRRTTHITTAGWPLSDAVAQRAAEKISAIPKGIIPHARISVHPYEKGTSHENPEKYQKDMENVLRTLKPIHPEILFFNEPLKKGHEEFITRALSPLYRLASEELGLRTSDWRRRISRYSGRAVGASPQTEDFDVMACMPGIHIWPDGTIALQDKDVFKNRKKGSRPTPIGKKLY